MRPMILTFNLSEARLAKLRFLCMKLGTAGKAVPAAECGQSIAALCGLGMAILVIALLTPASNEIDEVIEG